MYYLPTLKSGIGLFVDGQITISPFLGGVHGTSGACRLAVGSQIELRLKKVRHPTMILWPEEPLF